jgi:two-component system, LuxR family, sensor kinase FixL
MQSLSDTWNRVASAIGFVALYVALDWASFILPLQHLNVTPWNPAPALGLLFVIRRGRGAIVPLFVAIVASDIFVRDIPGNLAITLWLGATLTAGYLAIGWLLLRHCPDGGFFADRPGLLRWSAIVIAGSLGNSLLFVSTLLASGLLPAADWGDAVMRFWIGDGVGIFVTLPLLWWLQDDARRRAFAAAILRWETVAYSLLTLLVLWIAFVPGAAAHFRYFYVLFLPVVWAASRQGLAGAVFCVTALQLGMLLAGLLQQSAEVSLFELQMRAFLLALVGFLIGVAVDEQRRSAEDLRNSLRLAAAGEMAGALAHELNQPLTALSAYGSACEQLLERGAEAGQLRDVIRRMIGEAGRAAEVVRRLRDFFRTGETRLERIPLVELIEAVAAKFRDKAAATGVEFTVGALPAVVINADRLQLEVVLRNLLANAFEAVAEGNAAPGRVSVAASAAEGGYLMIEIADNGPGLPAAQAEQIFEPFASTKSSGLGLGLAISRAIAEAHGGSLTADGGGHGRFRLVLPIENLSRRNHG